MRAPVILICILISNFHNTVGDNLFSMLRNLGECTQGQVFQTDCYNCVCRAQNLTKCKRTACGKELKQTGSLSEYRRRNADEKKSLLTLASKGAQCKPGEIIRNKCTKCVCEFSGVLKCAKSKSCVTPQKKTLKGRQTKESRDERIKKIAATCNPADIRRLDCNTCLCIRRGEMACTAMKCSGAERKIKEELDSKAVLDVIADTCNKGDSVHDGCNSCGCETGRDLLCSVVACENNRNMLEISLVKVDKTQLRLLAQKCRKQDIIRLGCNTCTCRGPGDMPCTRKKCNPKKRSRGQNTNRQSACARTRITMAGPAPAENNRYVEGDSRYIWMPDGEGVPHLVDLHDEVALGSKKAGANNQYWLFTRKNPTDYQVVVQGNASSIKKSNYNSAHSLKVIVHGWMSDGTSAINPLITSAFLAVEDCNVIVLDWNALAHKFYNAAVGGVPSVGEHLGKFLIWLIDTTGGNWKDVHLVGFSLGAHVVGNAGSAAGGRPGRVTGLDPAGPMWASNKNALNAKNGVYVEIIHTDGGALGLQSIIGHADFYPNSGKSPQPGCSSMVGCSHSRAYELFASSIRTNHLIGRKCKDFLTATSGQCSGDTLPMGNHIQHKRGSGLYALRTGDSWPF